MAVLVCCVSVGSRKVRLGKFGQGGLGGVRHHLSWFGGLGLMRRGTERCGLVGQGGHGFSRLVEFWRGMAVQFG